MKVVLIEPPQISDGNISRFFGSFGTSKADFIWPPLELMSIAGHLNKYKIKTVIYDAGGLRKSLDDVKGFIAKENPTIVVFSTSTTTIYSDILVADIAKEVSQDIMTVAVGAHVMARPEETLKLTPKLDVAVYGEDEEIIVKDLIEFSPKLLMVKGICYRDPACAGRRSGTIKRNPARDTLANLDDLGFPAHNQIPKEIYYDFMSERKPMTLVMAQRGCINQCIFCICPALYKYRERSVASVIRELKWIKQLGYKEFKFVNAGTTYNLNWVNFLLDEMIKNKINLTWWSNARADRLTPQLLEKMKRAGCHTLAIGMESANREILKNIKKNLSPEQVRRAVKEIKIAGLKTAVYFILGLPGETKETLEETINFAKSLRADYITMGVAQPSPKTPFYNYLSKNNFLTTRDWRKYDPVKPPVYQYPNLTAQEIFEATKRGYRQFYLRPGYILRKIVQIRSLDELKSNFKNFINFIKRYL